MLLPAGILLPGALQEAKLLSMSTLNEEGVMDVKQTACERLLTSRVEVKMQVGLAPTVLPALAQQRPCMSVKGRRHQPLLRAQPAMACMQRPGPACSLRAPFAGVAVACCWAGWVWRGGRPLQVTAVCLSSSVWHAC